MKKAVMLHQVWNEEGDIEDVSCCDAIFHFVSVFWKVLFSLVPPPHFCGGWPCFVGSIFFIGLCTIVVTEVAELMCCVMGLLPPITAITFVAIGTSIPDTFASRIAAIEERYADEAIGNITGSNSVNVFLGLGLPWVIGSIYNVTKFGKNYSVPVNGVDSAVLFYVIISIVGITILMVRRCICKGELGGSLCTRWLSCIIFTLLWFTFIAISSLVISGTIKFNCV